MDSCPWYGNSKRDNSTNLFVKPCLGIKDATAIGKKQINLHGLFKNCSLTTCQGKFTLNMPEPPAPPNFLWTRK